MYLTETDIARIEKISARVAHLSPGKYTLAELCADDWPIMSDYNSFSRKFKRAVEAGLVPDIGLHKNKSASDTLIYTVHSTT